MNFSDRKYLPFFLLFSVVFISRLPFLSAGYGVEEDSWGIVLSAFHTKISGIYEPSRFPGHPIHEFIYSSFWGFPPFFYNAFSAFFSAIATTFFALILKELKFKHFFIGALAFAFTPVFFISSTYTIDFVWTIAFILISFYALLKNKLIVCGIFLGLAVGCRITSGAMLIPFAILYWEKNSIENFKNALKIGVPLVLISLISYLPLFIQFGTSFFMYYDQFPYPSLAKVFYKMIPGAFGFLGCLVMGICVLIIILKRNKIIKDDLYEGGLHKKIIISSFVVIVLFTISYLRLPQKSGYMITIIPFVIILFGYYLNRKLFNFFCASLILSSFFCGINLTDKIRGSAYSTSAVIIRVSGQELFFEPFSGPIFADYSKRIQKANYVNTVIQESNTITAKTVIISGWWYNQILVTEIPMKKNDSIIFEPYIDSKKMKSYISEGYEIKYLPEQNIYNNQMFEINCTDEFATEF